MSTEVWGTLPKAQDNAQTINEAITAAIAAHNDDPTAHMSDGQSLQTHRQDSTIDHPAASVLADKFSASQDVIICNFESLTAFSVSSGVTLAFPGVALQTSSSINTTRTLYSEAFGGMYGIDFNKNPFFQVTAYTDSWSNVYMHFGRGIYAGDDTALFLGFKIASGAMVGVVSVGTTDHTTSISLPTANIHFYRAYVDPISHDAIFMIDGVQVGSIAAASYYSAAIAADANPAFIDVAIKNTVASNKDLMLANLIIGTA